MSSDVQSTLQLFVLNNYLSLAGVTAVVYDYVLTFSREVSHPFFTSVSCLIMYKVEYIWCQPWTWVSTMFVVVRYIGLYFIVTAALIGTSFVPGPREVGKLMYLSCYWAFFVFLSTADVLMILRVYAMWNRSKTILRVLLLVFIIQTLISGILEGIYLNPNTHLSVTTIRIQDFSVCDNSTADKGFYGVYYVAARLALSALLAILAIIQTLKQSFEMYKATKQCQPNRYMQKLVKEGILYFIVNVLYQIGDLVRMTGFPEDTAYFFLKAFICTALYIPIPWFVINIRELYDRDIRGRFHVDTGFGVVSPLNAGADTTVSAMAFAAVNQGPEVEGGKDTSGDLEMGRRVHGSGSNESPSIGGRE
ncbi:hypothetical protein L210DRAFT_2064774 [Boletus edulis BED1]|uniref:DUF6533 domain-containing protein n=1 Tax=Boletus edulis BED1 TaxID=1328754 RepID=A0AAD4GMK5_BOLED|nr:hypothetical protein L210DRAFT_2064774 [Boletus edulis BED1]